MTDPTGNGDGVTESGGTPPGMPRWVKMLAVVVLALALALVVIMLVIGGEHGPGLHTGAVDRSGIVVFVLTGAPRTA